MFWLLFTAPVAAIAAVRGLRRVEPGGGEPSMALAAVAASLLAGGLHVLAIDQDVDAVMARPESIFLLGMLMIAGMVDLDTAWAPRELMIPICAAAGVVSPLGHGPEWPVQAAGMAAGLLLYPAMQLVWHLQDVTGMRAVPPADAAMFCLPAILFGFGVMSILCYASICAAAMFAVLAGRQQGLAEAARSLSLAGGRPVALVGVFAPVLFAALGAEIILASVGGSN